jgi:uncharacterized protein
MAFENPSREEIKEILENAKNIAVVGLSDNPERTSHMVAAAMQDRGYRIIPVNPKGGEILGEKVYKKLEDIPEPVDIVNVFRRSDAVVPFAVQAAQVNAKVFWLQLGIANDDAERIASEAGMKVIMDRCIKVEDAITRPNRKKA